MSVKQDRTGVRTPAQLEQKYSFGKKFSEIIGLIDDSRDKVDSVSSELRNKIEEVSELSRSTSEITAKVQKRVETVEGDVSTLKSESSSLKLTAGEISASVSSVEKRTTALEDSIETVKTEASTALTQTANDITATVSAVETNVGNLSADVSTLKSEVETKVDAEGVSIAIRDEMSNGVDRVETETGYIFDSDGLLISKSGEQMANKLDNTGMYVTRSGVEILTANDKGVTALNLHAKEYLIVGQGNGRSRFEDYTENGEPRTGCFWIEG